MKLKNTKRKTNVMKMEEKKRFKFKIISFYSENHAINK